MFHLFEFLKFGGQGEIYWILLVVVFLAIFIFEKNPKPEEEKYEENYEKEEYEDEMEEKEK